jgi:hypothetical protein
MSKFTKTIISNTFDKSKPLHLTGLTNSISSDTGELIIDGGCGIAKNLNVNGKIKSRLIESDDLIVGKINILKELYNKNNDLLNNKKNNKLEISGLIMQEPVIGFGYFVDKLIKQPKNNSIYINVNNNKIYYYHNSKWCEILNDNKRIICTETTIVHNITYIKNNIYVFNGSEWNIDIELINGLSLYVKDGNIFNNQIIAYMNSEWFDIGYTTNHNLMNNVGQISHNDIDKHILNQNIHKFYNQSLNNNDNVVFNSIECTNFLNNPNSLIRKKEFEDQYTNIANKIEENKNKIFEMINIDINNINKTIYDNQQDLKKLSMCSNNVLKEFEDIKKSYSNFTSVNKQAMESSINNISERIVTQLTESKDILLKLTEINKMELNNAISKNNEVLSKNYKQELNIFNSKITQLQNGVQLDFKNSISDINKMIEGIRINNSNLISKNDLQNGIRYIEDNLKKQREQRILEKQNSDKFINHSLNIGLNLKVGNSLLIDSTLKSNTYREGSLIVKGGVGIDGDVNINGDIKTTENIVSNKIYVNELHIDKKIFCNNLFETKNIKCDNITSNMLNIDGLLNCKNIKTNGINTNEFNGTNIIGNNLIINGNGNFESIIIGKDNNTNYNLIIYGNNIVHNNEIIDKNLSVKQNIKLYNNLEFYKNITDKACSNINIDNKNNLVINPLREVIINGCLNTQRLKCLNPPSENDDVLRLCDLDDLDILINRSENKVKDSNIKDNIIDTQEILINYSINSIVFYNDASNVINIKNIESIENDKILLNFCKINNFINLNITEFTIYLSENIRLFKINTQIKCEFNPKFNISINLLLFDDIFKNSVNIKLVLNKNGIINGIIYGNYKPNKKYSFIRSSYEKNNDELISGLSLNYITN